MIAASNGDHHQIRSGVRYHVPGGDNSVRAWEISTTRELHRLPMTRGYRYGPQSLSVSADGSRLAVGAGWWTANGPAEPSVYVFDLIKGELLANWSPPGNHAMRAVSFAADGKTVSCLQSGPGGIHSYSLEGSPALEHRTLSGVGVHAELPRLTWSRDGRWLLGADWGKHGPLLCWDSATGSVQQTFVGHQSAPLHAAISDDGTRVISVADDRTVRIWDVESGQSVTVLEQTSRSVGCVAISPDGQWFATGDNSGTVGIYLASDATPLALETVHIAAVRDLAISASGRLLASASDDGVVIVHKIQLARSKANSGEAGNSVVDDAPANNANALE